MSDVNNHSPTAPEPVPHPAVPPQPAPNWRCPPMNLGGMPSWPSMALHEHVIGGIRELGQAPEWCRLGSTLAFLGRKAAQMGAPPGDVVLAAFVAFDTLLMELTPADQGSAWARHFAAKMANAVRDMDLRDQAPHGHVG